MSSKRRPRSSAAIALTVLGSLERSNAFLVVAQPAAVSTATGANSQRRQQQQQQQQSCYAPVDNVPGGVLGGRLVCRDWRGCSGRVSRHVLHLEPEDRDLAFELLEAYIERESDSGGREDYDRIRGLVPHMRKRLWKAPSKQQDKMTEELGMDDFQFATKEYIPGLASHPWWEPGQFPWARQLEEASSAIQEEYRALRAREESESQFKNSKEGGYTSQGWTHIPLVNSREPQELYASQRAHFPKTLQILKDLGILANARAVLIGRQRPMSGIKMHSDGSNVIITCHLGLDVPGDEECLMWVGVDMERRAWRNNKLLCMDTSYLHWTRNNTDQERIILLVMVWHPDITPKEKKVLQYLDSLIEHASAGKPLPHHPPIMVEES